MPPINGSLVVVQVNTGTVALPVWTTVGGQRDLTKSGTLALIDFSSKDQRAEVVGGGRWTGELTFSNLYVPGAAEMALLSGANESGDVVQVRKFENGVAVETAEGVVTDFSEQHPDMDASTVDITIHISGGWVDVP